MSDKKFISYGDSTNFSEPTEVQIGDYDKQNQQLTVYYVKNGEFAVDNGELNGLILIIKKVDEKYFSLSYAITNGMGRNYDYLETRLMFVRNLS